MITGMDPMEDLPTEEGLFPIRTACALTGIHPVTLRAWERRYGLIRPKRTPKGHRLYSGEDIELIRHILRLLDQGVSIGQVGQLLDGRKAPAPAESGQTERGDHAWNAHRMRLLEAIAVLDSKGMMETWEDALSLFSLETAVNQLALPVQRSLRERPAADHLAAVELAFFNRWLHQTLDTRLRQLSPATGGFAVIVAPLEESPADICLLRFALACRRSGIQAHLLNPGAPLAGLDALAGKAGALALVLYSQGTPGQTARLSRFCEERGPEPVVLCALGGGFDPLPESLAAADVLNLGTDPDKAAARLHGHLTHRES
jgi:MerR family transcriptional regulator, light-induced transcriptional regulator